MKTLDRFKKRQAQQEGYFFSFYISTLGPELPFWEWAVLDPETAVGIDPEEYKSAEELDVNVRGPEDVKHEHDSIFFGTAQDFANLIRGTDIEFGSSYYSPPSEAPHYPQKNLPREGYELIQAAFREKDIEEVG